MRRIPDKMWNQCERQALRSPIEKFRTGAIMIDPKNGNVLAKGTSHKTEASAAFLSSIHAEIHTLRNAGPEASIGSWILLMTLNVNNDQVGCSRPCASCTRQLYKAGVEMVVFYERDQFGHWHEMRERVEDLMVAAANIPLSRYSNKMQLPSPFDKVAA